jgi:hypothetical protein
MKTTWSRCCLFLLMATAGTLFLSWTPVQQQRKTVFTEFLETQSIPLNAEIVNTTYVRDFLSLKMLGLKKKKLTVDKGIHWSVSQTGSPYRDANLKLSLDGTEIAFEFWTTTNSYPFYYDNKWHHQLRIECPIFEQWETTGDYYLKIVDVWEDMTLHVTTLYEDTVPCDSQNTPRITPSPHDLTFTVWEGHAYYITLEAKYRAVPGEQN